MTIKKHEIKRLAEMASLAIPEEDIGKYEDIADVLAFVEQIQAVDTTHVEPMTHAVDIVSPLREDKVTEKNEWDILQKLAPKNIEAGLYIVPRVLDEES